jgi:hypothetical protein
MRKDYTGMRFGKLTAISDTHTNRRKQAVWLFRCDCGRFVKRVACKVWESVRTGHTPACKKCLSPRFDLTNQRFGKLVALKETGIHKGSVLWLFKCDCGRQVEFVGNHVVQRVKDGFTPSCGDYECNGRPKKSNAFVVSLRSHYLRGAMERGLTFDLAIEEFQTLVAGDCYYCGQPPTQTYIPHGTKKFGRPREPLVYNGIDRVDNNLGYIPGNVVSCCKECNFAKRKMSHDDFIALAIRIARKHGG